MHIVFLLRNLESCHSLERGIPRSSELFLRRVRPAFKCRPTDFMHDNRIGDGLTNLGAVKRTMGNGTTRYKFGRRR